MTDKKKQVEAISQDQLEGVCGGGKRLPKSPDSSGFSGNGFDSGVGSADDDLAGLMGGGSIGSLAGDGVSR